MVSPQMKAIRNDWKYPAIKKDMINKVTNVIPFTSDLEMS